MSTFIFFDNDSYTTYENSQRAARAVQRILYCPSQLAIITHFCEATRATNVMMLDRHFLKDLVETIDDITVETARWERADPFKQARNLIYTKLAIKFPWLGLAEWERRKRIRRSEHI